jgi:hypothetical protein
VAKCPLATRRNRSLFLVGSLTMLIITDSTPFQPGGRTRRKI